MKNKNMLLIVWALGLIMINGCSQITTQTPTGSTITKVQSTGEIKEFEIIAKNWEFVPDTIGVNLGDKVELHIESVDVAM